MTLVNEVGLLQKINVKSSEFGHPTEKQSSLLEKYIKISSSKNQTILDPFAGSGTTAIACINTNRKFILIEKELEYCKIIAKRIEQHLSQATLFDFTN